MTREQETKPRRTVTVTVFVHEVHNGKPLTKLDIPEWQSQYPLTLYGTTPEQQALLPMSKTLRIVIQCDRQKDNTDGSKPWNFFWSFVEVAGYSGEEEPPPESKPAPQVAQNSAPRSDGPAPRGRDQGAQIHRSVALQQAVLYSGNALSPAEVCENAEVFFAWLIGETA